MDKNRFLSCLNKQNQLKNRFMKCKGQSEKYQMLIDLGKELPPFPFRMKGDSCLVEGCQSKVYVLAEQKEENIIFWGSSDALISSGLVAILIAVYSMEPPEAILKVPPAYLKDLGLQESLSPMRANGLYQIHLKMQQEALKILVMDKS